MGGAACRTLGWRQRTAAVPLVLLLGAVIAAFFANDGAALLLTPIAMAILLRLNFSAAVDLAFIVACGFVADTTSLPLVISNLVNIVSANYFGIGFDRYAAVIAPVTLVALSATLAVLWAYYGRDLRARYRLDQLERPATDIRDPLVFHAAFPLLVDFALSPMGVPVAAGDRRRGPCAGTYLRA